MGARLQRNKSGKLYVFAHGCDVTSMSVLGSPMALTPSITHSLD